jgi:hypothetical protein
VVVGDKVNYYAIFGAKIDEYREKQWWFSVCMQTYFSLTYMHTNIYTYTYMKSRLGFSRKKLIV